MFNYGHQLTLFNGSWELTRPATNIIVALGIRNMVFMSGRIVDTPVPASIATLSRKAFRNEIDVLSQITGASPMYDFFKFLLLTIYKNESVQGLCYNSGFHANSNHDVTMN